MPNDTLNKAIKRGAGELEGAEYVEGTMRVMVQMVLV